MTGRCSAAILVLLATVAAIVAIVQAGRESGYIVHAQFGNIGGLREGFRVLIDGVPVGKVTRIELGRGDHPAVEARIEESAGPLGRGARATVRAANVLGEKYLDLERGDARHPEPSGLVIPAPRTGVAVELDDVIDALDVPTQAALQVVIGESGTGLRGRGRDLGAALAALPHALDATGELLDELGHDNRTLGRLVDESDRVVRAVARERVSLGRLVSGAATTLDTLASRRRDLGETVRRAPATLGALRRALAALEGAAIPLAPAARGLRATAPQLTATLQQLPAFARTARPTLRTVRDVAPTLSELGRRGTPTVRRLLPLAGELLTFASGVDPFTRATDQAIGDTLGVLEGWARSTAPRDAAGHVFRAGATVGRDLFQALLAGDPKAAQKRRGSRDAAPAAPSPPQAPAASEPRLPRPPRVGLPRVPRVPGLRLPDLPKPNLPDLGLSQPDGRGMDRLLDYLLAP